MAAFALHQEIHTLVIVPILDTQELTVKHVYKIHKFIKIKTKNSKIYIFNTKKNLTIKKIHIFVLLDPVSIWLVTSSFILLFDVAFSIVILLFFFAPAKLEVVAFVSFISQMTM